MIIFYMASTGTSLGASGIQAEGLGGFPGFWDWGGFGGLGFRIFRGFGVGGSGFRACRLLGGGSPRVTVRAGGL